MVYCDHKAPVQYGIGTQRLNRDVASPLFQVLKNKYSNQKSNKASEELKKYYTIMKEYIYRKIFCTGNKAF